MKAGWKIAKLGDVCHVYQPETLSQKQLRDGPYPVYGANGQIGFHNEFNHAEPQLTLGCRGTCGVVNWTTENAWINGNAMVVKAVEELVIPQFLSYALKGGINIGDSISGTAQPQITRKSLTPIEIPLPPLAEQKRIVALLDEAFAGIDEAKAKVAHLNKSTSSILPAKLNQVFSQPLATGPKLSINDFSQVYDGPHATPKTTDKGPIFLGISSLKDGAIELSETRHVSLQDFKRWTRRVQPQAGDVVFSYETRIGQVAVIPDNLECCLGRRMGLVRLDNQRMMPGFFAFQYLSPPFQKFLQSKTVKGVTVDRISLKEFPSFEIWVPGLSLQKKINQEVQESQTLALHLSRLLAKKLDHLNELKTSLLRQAFTGALFT